LKRRIIIGKAHARIDDIFTANTLIINQITNLRGKWRRIFEAINGFEHTAGGSSGTLVGVCTAVADYFIPGPGTVVEVMSDVELRESIRRKFALRGEGRDGIGIKSIICPLPFCPKPIDIGVEQEK